jgi:tetratricopeptide (TPR) repeat protein
VSFGALLGLAVTLRDRGDLNGAEQTLAKALAVCERAGLIPQSIRVHSALALVCALAGREQPAREAAERAEALAARVHDPVGQACALEARGVVAEHPAAREALAEARAAWERLGRRLDVARCDLLLGRRLRGHDPEAAAEVLARAAAAYDELGVRHLAEQSRELVAV